MQLADKWCRKHALPGMKQEIVRLPGRTPVLFMEIPEGKAQRQRPDVRPPRQAAGDDRLARGLRAVDAGDRGRQALRARRRRRRLRGLRFACLPCGPFTSAAGPHSQHQDPHRVLRGERQLRPAALPRASCFEDRHARPGHRPRLGLRQLRAALGHDLAARAGERRADGRGADRGRALGRRERRGGVELPHPARAARAHRRRRRPAWCSHAAFHAPIPPERGEQAKRAARCWARRSGASFRSPAA